MEGDTEEAREKPAHAGGLCRPRPDAPTPFQQEASWLWGRIRLRDPHVDDAAAGAVGALAEKG